MKRHPPLWCSGLLLVLLLASSVWGENLQGDGSVNDPYHWDGGLVGVTATCKVYARTSLASPWETALETTVNVVGMGTVNDPHKITGGIKGLACSSAGGTAKVTIVYWNGTSWVDTLPQSTTNPAGTSATADAAIITPDQAIASSGTASPLLATSQRGKQLDEVWMKIRGFIVKADDDKVRKIWHGRWKFYEEIYTPELLTVSKQKIVDVAMEEYTRWNSGKLKETDPEGKRIVEELYFKEGTGKDRSADAAWSAAFISYVMKKAGVVTFPPSVAHTAYFRKIKNGESVTCKTFPMADVEKIQPGDILCSCRDSGCPIDYNTFPDGTKESHCNIVIGKNQGTLEMIGGNVNQNVDKVVKPLNEVKFAKEYFGFISCSSLSIS